MGMRMLWNQHKTIYWVKVPGGGALTFKLNLLHSRFVSLFFWTCCIFWPLFSFHTFHLKRCCIAAEQVRRVVKEDLNDLSDWAASSCLLSEYIETFLYCSDFLFGSIHLQLLHSLVLDLSLYMEEQLTFSRIYWMTFCCLLDNCL